MKCFSCIPGIRIDLDICPIIFRTVLNIQSLFFIQYGHNMVFIITDCPSIVASACDKTPLLGIRTIAYPALYVSSIFRCSARYIQTQSIMFGNNIKPPSG